MPAISLHNKAIPAVEVVVLDLTGPLSVPMSVGASTNTGGGTVQ